MCGLCMLKIYVVLQKKGNYLMGQSKQEYFQGYKYNCWQYKNYYAAFGVTQTSSYFKTI